MKKIVPNTAASRTRHEKDVWGGSKPVKEIAQVRSNQVTHSNPSPDVGSLPSTTTRTTALRSVQPMRKVYPASSIREWLTAHSKMARSPMKEARQPSQSTRDCIVAKHASTLSPSRPPFAPPLTTIATCTNESEEQDRESRLACSRSAGSSVQHEAGRALCNPDSFSLDPTQPADTCATLPDVYERSTQGCDEALAHQTKEETAKECAGVSQLHSTCSPFPPPLRPAQSNPLRYVAGETTEGEGGTSNSIGDCITHPVSCSLISPPCASMRPNSSPSLSALVSASDCSDGLSGDVTSSLSSISRYHPAQQQQQQQQQQQSEQHESPCNWLTHTDNHIVARCFSTAYGTIGGTWPRPVRQSPCVPSYTLGVFHRAQAGSTDHNSNNYINQNEQHSNRDTSNSKMISNSIAGREIDQSPFRPSSFFCIRRANEQVDEEDENNFTLQRIEENNSRRRQRIEGWPTVTGLVTPMQSQRPAACLAIERSEATGSRALEQALRFHYPTYSVNDNNGKEHAKEDVDIGNGHRIVYEEDDEEGMRLTSTAPRTRPRRAPSPSRPRCRNSGALRVVVAPLTHLRQRAKLSVPTSDTNTVSANSVLSLSPRASLPLNNKNRSGIVDGTILPDRSKDNYSTCSSSVSYCNNSSSSNLHSNNTTMTIHNSSNSTTNSSRISNSNNVPHTTLYSGSNNKNDNNTTNSSRDESVGEDGNTSAALTAQQPSHRRLGSLGDGVLSSCMSVMARLSRGSTGVIEGGRPSEMSLCEAAEDEPQIDEVRYLREQERLEAADAEAEQCFHAMQREREVLVYSQYARDVRGGHSAVEVHRSNEAYTDEMPHTINISTDENNTCNIIDKLIRNENIEMCDEVHESHARLGGCVLNEAIQGAASESITLCIHPSRATCVASATEAIHNTTNSTRIASHGLEKRASVEDVWNEGGVEFAAFRVHPQHEVVHGDATGGYRVKEALRTGSSESNMRDNSPPQRDRSMAPAELRAERRQTLLSQQQQQHVRKR